MDRLSGAACFFYKINQASGRDFFCNTNGFRQFFHRRHCAHPNYIFNAQVVAEDDLPVVININNRSQSWLVDTKEVQEITILPEMIGIAGIVHADFIVTQEEGQAGFQVFFKSVASGFIGIRRKHSCMYLVEA